jgi:Conserved region of Rad21 / Rec8 like protein
MTLQARFPPERTSRLVLANALYHTCCYPFPNRVLTVVLATRGIVVVSQTNPYGDISLKMVV